jgi:[ribosomal protein S5]-alanine N-acetyltransferase
MIETQRLQLKPFEEAHFKAAMKNDLIKLGWLLKVKTPAQWTTFKDMADALPYFYETYKFHGTTWGSFFITHKKDKVLLGTCGFKGGPDEEDIVEIGYEIKEDYRSQGLASEAAKGLMDYAFASGRVKKVWAHTLAVENASGSVLKKLGFTFIGEFHDPEDGDIWRWEISRQKWSEVS